MKNQIKIILIALFATVLAACETVPEKKEVPKPAVTAPDAASAIIAADVAISKAKKRNNLWRDTTKILDKADNAMAADEFADAQKLANQARSQAELASKQSYRGDALFIISALHSDYMDQMTAGQKSQLGDAQSALDEGSVQVAYDISSSIMAELKAEMNAEATSAPETPKEMAASAPAAKESPQPASTSASTLSTYTVASSDNLWSIAAKPEVYGNVDMWPLLWKANKDKIKRPDAIEVGMKLTIDRSSPPEAIAAAIKYSKLRGATSLGPVDAFDQKYINK